MAYYFGPPCTFVSKLKSGSFRSSPHCNGSCISCNRLGLSKSCCCCCCWWWWWWWWRVDDDERWCWCCGAERRFFAERSDSEQRRRHLLHLDRRPRPLHGRLTARVRLQVQATGRPQKGASWVCQLEAIQRWSAICRVWSWTLTYQKFLLCISSQDQDLCSNQKLNMYIYWFSSESGYRRRRRPRRRRRWRRRRRQRRTPQYNHYGDISPMNLYRTDQLSGTSLTIGSVFFPCACSKFWRGGGFNSAVFSLLGYLRHYREAIRNTRSKCETKLNWTRSPAER